MGKIEIHQDLRRIFPSPLDRAYSLSKEHRHVEDIMSTGVVTIAPEKTMKEAAMEMGKRRIGSLIVVEGPHGIVTERDLLSNVLAKGEDPATVTVKDVMSAPLVTIARDATIKVAAQTMMVRRKARLVVMEEGEMVGILTSSDLVKSMPEVPQTLQTVEEFMTKHVESVEGDTSVNSVAKTMGEKRIGSIIATEEGQPEGIFTERDLLTKFFAEDKPMDAPVIEASSSPIIATIPRTTVNEAAYAMTSKGIRRLPIARDHELIGIITARDLVRAYAH